MSNRGKSPLTRTRAERDAIVQCWVDRRTLATIGTYMESKGIKLNFMADILNFCLETTKTLVLKANSPYIGNTSDATAFIDSRFRINLNYRGKGQKNLISNLLTESEASGADAEKTGLSVSPELVAFLKERAIASRKGEGERVSGDDLLTTRSEKDSESLREQSKLFADIAKANVEVVEDE